MTPNTSQKSVSVINVQTNLPSLTHCPQIIPFYDTSFFKYKNYFQGFFLPDDYSLDMTTLQQQQSQDPVLRTVFSSIVKNEKLETLTPLITGTPFLHAYYERFSQLYIDDSTNLISLYNKHPTVQNQPSTPEFDALLFEYLFLSDCSKLFLTNFMNTSIQVSKLHIIQSHNINTFHLLKNGFPFSFMTVLNVNAINTST